MISQQESDYLRSMAQNSPTAESTRELVCSNGAPDFQYAALYFSTMIWQLGDVAENDAEARAGYMLAQFALAQESPGHDSFWATKLLREFYDDHAGPTQPAVGDLSELQYPLRQQN